MTEDEFSLLLDRNEQEIRKVMDDFQKNSREFDKKLLEILSRL